MTLSPCSDEAHNYVAVSQRQRTLNLSNIGVRMHFLFEIIITSLSTRIVTANEKEEKKKKNNNNRRLSFSHMSIHSFDLRLDTFFEV